MSAINRVIPARRGLNAPSFVVSGPAFSDPTAIAGLQLYALDGGNAYETDLIGQHRVLRSLEDYGDYRSPRRGRCYLFDGSDDYGTITNAAFALSGELTITAWVKPTSDTANQSIAVCSSGGPTYFGFTYGFTNNQLGFWQTGASEAALSDSLTLAGSWNHVAVVRSGSAGNWTITFYVNGVVSGTPTNTATDPSGVGTLAFSTGRFGSFNAIFYAGSMRDLRVYSSAKTQLQVAAIYNDTYTAPDTADLVAAYWMNEEDGTTAYDVSGNGYHLTLTNTTAATFHASDSGVTANPNNLVGYNLSGSTYIPKRLSDTNAADGNALSETGQCPYPVNVETPCISLGSVASSGIFTNAEYIPKSGDFDVYVDFFHSGTGLTNFETVYSQQEAVSWSSACSFFYSSTASVWRICYGLYTLNFVSFTFSYGVWHTIRLNKTGTTLTVYVDGVLAGTGTGTSTISSVHNTVIGNYLQSTPSNLNASATSRGRIANFRVVASGVTTYIPLQDGPGSSNTNRDISYVKSDGAYGVMSSALINGTVSTIWANRSTISDDWSILYGGDIAANGAFLPGQISGSLAADGTAKTLAAGKFGNPFSRVNFNAFSAAEFNGRSVPTAYEVADDINATVTPSETAFRRTAADGDDRLLIYKTALAGGNLTDIEGYTS